MNANLNIFGGISEKIRDTFAETWRRNAVKSIQREETAREFYGLILGFVLLRLATSFCSIFSGWAFFNVELAKLITNDTAREIAAVSLLAVIELITAGFLFKFFKFIFSHRWGLAGAMLAGAAVFFFVSFHTSTRGIAMYKSNTTDQNVFIEQKAAAGVDSIANYYGQQIELIKVSINEIRPQTWNKRRQVTPDGRDTTVYLLTTAQEQTKTDLYNKIIQLQTAQGEAVTAYRQQIDAEKQRTQATADVEADKYYLYVAIIMLLQLTANGVLCFFYTRIYHENNRADEIAADVADFANVIADNTDALINRQTTQQYNAYLGGLERRLLALQSATGQPTNQPTNAGTYARARVTNVVCNETTNETTNQAANETRDNLAAGQPTKQPTKHVTIRGFAFGDAEAEPDNQAEPGDTPDGNQHGNQAGGPHSLTVQPTARPGVDEAPDNGNQPGKTKIVYVGDGHRFCQYCGKPFFPRHNRQIYCCDPHRGQACANRNGKTYWFAGVKYEPETKTK